MIKEILESGIFARCKLKRSERVEKGVSFPLMEAFYTLQGEGYHKGSAAYFIRIGGCDVGCHWCDVKESWDAESTSTLLISNC